MAVKVLAKRGTAAQIEGAASSVQTAGEIAFATDTKDFYVSDGTQFNKIGKDQLSQFGEISVVNEVSSWHLSTTNILDLNPPEANPTGITFKPDGTRMFTLGYSRNRVQQYDLSTAWDLTSAGSPTESEYLVQNNLSSTQEDFFIDSSGTRMYVVSRSSDSIGQFTLNTAWDISDITFVQDLHINSTSLSGGVTGVVTGEPDPSGLTFKPDGTILYLVGYNQDKVHQIPLSTAWDISTHGTITELSISPANASQSIQFSSDGKEMYILDYSLDGIAHFTLSTAWDVTTANLTTQSIAFIRVDEGTPTGLYYRDDLGKCFIVGRSGDFAREVIANDIYSFNEGITAPVVYSPQINADRLSTGGGGGGSNNFYNATYARTTFQSSSTTYLGYETSSPLIRFGNNLTNNARIQVSRFTYLGAETADDPSRVPRFMVFPSLVGAKSKVYFGQLLEDTTYLVGGSMDIESIADTFDHKGEITLGGELKVSGTKPLAYKNPNLYTQGTQIVLDNFNETTETTLDNHTPDTGSGYTNVYISSAISFPTHLPIIEANAGYLRPALNNSNDGYRFVNDTTISTNNYEARAVIKRQHGGDDPFVLFVKYIDEDNYFAISFGNNYVYCSPISVVNGVYSTHGYLYYYANTSTADNENIEVALRVVGNNVHVFYEGVYRGSREINITGAGKAGIGFGKMNDSQYTSYDIGINNHISKFEVYELPDSLFDGSDAVHYIENGSLGIGTTSPAYKLHVNGTARFEDAITLSDDVNNRIDADATGLLFKSAAHYTFSKGANTLMFIKETGNVGIGTTNPSGTLHSYKTTDNYVYIERGGGAALKLLAASNRADFGTSNNHPFNITTNNQIGLTLDTSQNVGIATTSPSEKLHVSNGGNIRVDGSEIYLTQASSSRKPVRLHQAGYKGAITLQRDGVDKVHISSDQPNQGHTYFNGDSVNVGIGTTSPSEKLEVSGNIKATRVVSDILRDTNDNSHLQTTVTNASNTATVVGNSATANTLTLGVKSAGNVVVPNGNVGIGTTSPNAILDVQGSKIHLGTGGSNSNRAFFIANTTTNTFEFNNSVGDRGIRILTNSGLVGGAAASRLYGAAGGVLLEGANGQENIALTTDGKVGIGTTSPYATLTVAGNITQTGNSYLISTRKITARDAAGLALYNDGGQGIDIKDNNDVIVTSGSGNVGIGTTSPTAKLDVVGKGVFESVDIFKVDATANPRLRVGRYDAETLNFDVDDLIARIYHKQDETGSSVHKLNLTVDSDSTGGSEINLGFRDNDGSNESTKLAILSTGNVGIGTTSPETQLDITGNLTIGDRIYTRADGNRNTYIDSGTDIWRFYGGGNELLELSYAGGAVFNEGGADRDFRVESSTNSHMLFVDAGNNRVGIGTTSPTTALQVVGRTKTSELHASNGNAIYTNQGSVAIGTSQVDATAVLNIASTTKGVLFPRMTSAQRTAISSPTTGLIVYQTDATEGLYIYKSTGWTQII